MGFVKWLTSGFNNFESSVNITIGSGNKITVNGKKIDPSSPEGKKIIEDTDKMLLQMGTDMSKMFSGMSDMFKNMFK